MASYKLFILSPAGKAFDGEAESVVAPGAQGDLGVLAHHAPMIAALRPGVTTVKTAHGPSVFFTGEGVIEVGRDEVVLLVDEAVKTDDAAAAKELLKQRNAKASAP